MLGINHRAGCVHGKHLWAEQHLTRQLGVPTEAFYPFSGTQEDLNRSVEAWLSIGLDFAVAGRFTLE